MAARAGVIADAKGTADQRARAIEIAQRAADPQRQQGRPNARYAGHAVVMTRQERAALAELAKVNSLPIEKEPAISTAADPGAHMNGSLLQTFGITASASDVCKKANPASRTSLTQESDTSAGGA